LVNQESLVLLEFQGRLEDLEKLAKKDPQDHLDPRVDLE